jgi:outer membrane protein OmpA-like peptidoglycan-associated protein
MRAVQHIFGDYGLTFAGVIFDKGEHFLKAGGTLKLLQGIAASYMQTDNLYYYYNGEQYPGAKPLSWNSSYVYGGLSDNWGFYDEQGVYNFAVNYQLTAKPSVGLDLGVVYEFRPKYKDFYYTSGKDTLPRNDKNKYFVKVGISLLDIGRLKYEKRYNSSDMLVALTPDYLNRYNSVDNSVPVNTNWMDGNNINFSFWNYVNFADTMYHRAVNGQGVQFAAENKEKFTVKLPAAISLQVDLYLLKGLYVNITTYTALNQGYSTKPNSHYVSNYSITPRYERKWYSVSVPVIINQYKKLDVGLGVRAGAVYFGVNNLFSNVFSDPYGMHWYVGLKVPIPYKDPTKQPKPPKLPKQKPQPQIIICCPCSGYTQPDSLCRKCFQQIFRDTNNLKKMDCIPCGVQIIINNPTINIGTTNVSEQKNEIKKDSVITPPQPPTPPLPAIPCIQFEFDKSDLITSEIPYLVDLAKILNDNPSYELTIYGHTDSFGTDSYNMGLSKKRAEAARAYLLNKGVRNRIKIIPCGESQPVAGNTTDSGRQMNRRVCFDLIKSGASSINSIQGTHTKIIAVHHLTRKQIPTFNTTDVSPSSVQTYAFIPPTSGLIQPVKHKKRNSKFKI